MKLLVAIDASQPSCEVVSEVARRPWPAGTTVCVLHVIDWPQLPSGELLVEGYRHSAETLVESACAKLAKAGLKAKGKVIDGHPRSDVAQYAGEWGADLALVGSQGAGGLARFLMGSTAQAVLRNAPCAVEIVRRPAPQPAPGSAGMKLLVATDGSECSIAAVRSIAQRPWPAGSQVRVISVIPVIPGVGGSDPVSPLYLPSDMFGTLQEEARRRAEEAVARASKILREAGMPPVQSAFPIGDARPVILDEAKEWGADLIVAGSHGYRGVDRLMLGSVSESVAMHAHCSVEVIRDSKPAADKEPR